MARITEVKAAQQRYATVPVLDEDGKPKTAPVLDRTGRQKTTKHGKPIVRSITVADRSQPLDPHTCEGCRQPINVGQSYRWVKPKSGPYGGRMRTRHTECGTWQRWDLSNSLDAQVERIQYEGGNALAEAECADDISSALEAAADEVDTLAEEKREAAENIRDGFGHDTQQSEEIDEKAEALEEWAENLRGWTADEDEPENCGSCHGEDFEECDDCEDGKASEDEIAQWLEAAQESATEVLNDVNL